MNVADALRTYERVKRARKQELCGSLEGGPDAYNYLPERCVKRSKRTAKKRQSSTLQAEQIPVTNPERLSEKSLESLKKMVDRLKAKKTDKEIDLLRKRMAALTNGSSDPLKKLVKKVTEPLLKKISELPTFVAFACFKFTDRSLIVAFPDHEDRWEEINRIWPGKYKFVNDLDAKVSVMAFAFQMLSR